MKAALKYFLVHTVFVWLASVCFAQITFTEHVVTVNFGGSHSAWADDIDGDDDIDLLGTAQNADDLTWWENDGEQNFTEHTIDGFFDCARHAITADIDDDGDIDVVAAAWQAGDIAWFENDGNQNFTEHTIAGTFAGASMVYAADIDGDGDMDVAGAASGANDIAWWENDGNQNFTEHTIDGNYNCTRHVHVDDVDGDDDIDVLGTAQLANEITWWENDGEQPPDFTEHTLSDNFTSPAGVYTADLDDDGDTDILGASPGERLVNWWENNGEQPPEFTEHTIADDYAGRVIHTGDIDLDGDLDVLCIDGGADEVTWFENDGEENFTEHTITDTFDDPYTVMAVDIDGDTDIDVLAAAYAGDEITWWENNLDPQPDASVEGTVTDAETGDPVEGAEVCFGAFEAVTDEDGNYRIDELFSITYTVRIIAEGFVEYVEAGVEVEEGDNTVDFELHYPASIVIDPDSLEFLCPEDDADTTTLTISNDGGVDLEWLIIIEDAEWLTVDEESGSVEPDSEFAVTVIGDADDLTEGAYETMLEIRSNDPESDTLEVPVIFYVGFDPPDAFDLLSPDSAFWSFDTEVELEWEEATDFDPDDEVVYDLFIADDPDSLGESFAEDLTETTYTFDAPEQQDYFWAVRARDLLGMTTWSNQTWSFFVDYPEPPTDFALLEPENGAVIDFGGELQEETDIQFTWESSSDPDPQDNPVYTLNFIVTMPDSSEEMLEITRLRDTVQTVDLPAEFEIGGWDVTLAVQWWVVASSGDDELECEQHFTFTIEPYSEVADKPFSGIPTEFSIAAAYPNPFNPSMTVVVGLPYSGELRVAVFNILGREVAVLADGHYSAGYRSFTFDASNLSSGIFFIHANVPGKLDELRKVVLIK